MSNLPRFFEGEIAGGCPVVTQYQPVFLLESKPKGWTISESPDLLVSTIGNFSDRGKCFRNKWLHRAFEIFIKLSSDECGVPKLT